MAKYDEVYVSGITVRRPRRGSCGPSEARYPCTLVRVTIYHGPIYESEETYELGAGFATALRADFGRALAAIGLVAGSGALYRKIASRMRSRPAKTILRDAAERGIPGLTYTGQGTWRSDAGLRYIREVGPQRENSLRHVFRHTRSRPEHPKHTVFALAPRDLPQLIDEAWKLAAPVETSGKIVVDMRRRIGTKGERFVAVAYKKKNQIITAFPVSPLDR